MHQNQQTLRQCQQVHEALRFSCEKLRTAAAVKRSFAARVHDLLVIAYAHDSQLDAAPGAHAEHAAGLTAHTLSAHKQAGNFMLVF